MTMQLVRRVSHRRGVGNIEIDRLGNSRTTRERPKSTARSRRGFNSSLSTRFSRSRFAPVLSEHNFGFLTRNRQKSPSVREKPCLVGVQCKHVFTRRGWMLTEHPSIYHFFCLKGIASSPVSINVGIHQASRFRVETGPSGMIIICQVSA